MGRCQKMSIFDFKVNFLCQKSFESFSPFFIEEYQFRSTFFVIDIFDKGPSAKDVRRFSPIFGPYPPHVCNCLHFKYPSLKRMSANREFTPYPSHKLVMNFFAVSYSKLALESKVSTYLNSSFCLIL